MVGINFFSLENTGPVVLHVVIVHQAPGYGHGRNIIHCLGIFVTPVSAISVTQAIFSPS
jgi:hypothetical protein